MDAARRALVLICLAAGLAAAAAPDGGAEAMTPAQSRALVEQQLRAWAKGAKTTPERSTEGPR